MSRKIIVLAVVLALLSVALPSVMGQDSQTVSYFTFSAAPDHLEDLDQIIAAFEEANPGITVEVETAPFADYFTLLQADVASGDAPDVFELNYESFVTYAANGVLMPVELSSDDLAYYPRALEAFQYEGAQYALPESFSTVLLFYNKDLFDQAGVEYPTAEWTWDDALEAATAIRGLGDDVWGIYSPIQFWEFYKKAAQNNCEFFNADMTESTLNSAECVETLERMISLIDADVMPDEAELSGVANEELFLQGKLGMVVVGNWQFAAYADAPFAWDIEVEPGAAQKANHFFANGIAVSATTDVPEAATLWAEFLTASQTAAEVRVASGWELPALDQPEYFEAYLAEPLPENREAVFAALENPVTPPVIERQNEMQDTVNALLGQVVSGELTAQEALDQAKAELDTLIQ